MRIGYLDSTPFWLGSQTGARIFGKPGSTHFPAEISARTNNFGLLRLTLAILVVVSHSFPLSGHRDSEPLKWLTGTMSLGDLAVDGFFVLSGFLISHSFFHSRGVSDFLRKRVLRIYPAFVVVSLLGVLVVGYIGSEFEAGYYRQISIWKFAASLLLLWNYQPHPVFVHQPFMGCANGALWTIPIEFRSYVLIAAMGLTGLLSRRRVVLAFFLAAFICFAIQLPNKPTHGPANEWPRFLTCLAAGMLFYSYRTKIPKSGLLAIGSTCILVLASLTHFGLQLATPLFGGYVLLYIALGKKLPMRGLGDKVDLSYGIYLYAYPLQQLIMMWSGRPLSPILLFCAVMPPLIVCAALSWVLVEQPFLQAKATKRRSHDLQTRRDGRSDYPSPNSVSDMANNVVYNNR